MAGVPSAQRILGLISLICDCKYGLQASISDFLGALLFGGLHLTMFVMNTSELFSPMVYAVAGELFAAHLSEAIGEPPFRRFHGIYEDGANTIKTSVVVDAL